MGKLTTDEMKALAFFKTNGAIGPAPGWNADCELAYGDLVVDGTVLAELFKRGFLTASPIPPPHTEDSSEESGSIVRDHEWSLSDLGRAALAEHGEKL